MKAVAYRAYLMSPVNVIIPEKKTKKGFFRLNYAN